MADNGASPAAPKTVQPLSEKAKEKAAARQRAEADFRVRQLSYSAPIHKPAAPAPRANVGHAAEPIATLRDRIDRLTLHALDIIEQEGLYTDGQPHPLAQTLGVFLSFGVEHRRLAVERKTFKLDFADELDGK